MITAVLYCLFALSIILGFVIGWLGNEKFTAYMEREEHHYEELFKENPHPEIYDKDGEIFKGEYINISFELGYDPDDFSPEDIIEEGG